MDGKEHIMGYFSIDSWWISQDVDVIYHFFEDLLIGTPVVGDDVVDTMQINSNQLVSFWAKT